MHPLYARVVAPRVATLPALIAPYLLHHVTAVRATLLDDEVSSTAVSLATVVGVAITLAAIGALVAFAGSTQLT